ncbi:MAG: sensor histidine kinase [Novosphingobium sp.]|nr:MAG: sensor histidine kinase [Novosphingobium sp.]
MSDSDADIEAAEDVASLIVTRDWSASPLGPPETWSTSLRTTVGMLLRAHAEIVLFWGPDFVALYNDSYAPTIGDKHPRALGRPARENWAELWDDLEPLLRGVYETGETFSAKDRAFYIERHGYGETVYFDISYSAVPDDRGGIGGVLCIVSETTERHRAGEHLQLVVHELNHRMKNSLAMVQSIARQTFRNAEDLNDAQERFSARLIALAQANDLLTGERGARASLRGAVAQAVAPYQPSEHRVELIGPEVLLRPKSALTLTLAMHELATNAVKYGAWSNDRGTVTVEWSRHETGEGAERLHIEWRETGGPPVVPPARRGFGSRLIERGLAGELDGEVELIFAETGLRCTVDAPLPALRES